MSNIKKYIIEKRPELDFFQLTAKEIDRIAQSIEFSIWKTNTAAQELKSACDDWADNCKI